MVVESVATSSLAAFNATEFSNFPSLVVMPDTALLSFLSSDEMLDCISPRMSWGKSITECCGSCCM